MASLEERIAARLREVLAHQERGGFNAPGAEQGMAIGGPDNPAIVLTVEDVARIAAQVVKGPDLSRPSTMTSDEWREKMAEMGMVSTPEGRAWAKQALTRSRERQADVDWVGVRRKIQEMADGGSADDLLDAVLPDRPGEA